MVLWVSAALAAIGFSLASSVRGEVERTATAVDGLRSYYLAVGGVQRGMIELLWTALHPEVRTIPQGTTFLDYTFPSGVVRLEILPETGKLDVNRVPMLDLVRLLVALGEDEGRAREVAAAIVDFRGPGTSGGPPPPTGGLDPLAPGATPSFRPSHASFQEIEELLLVRGVTPDLFYGTYVPPDSADSGSDSTGPRLVRHGGLFDCLSVYGTQDAVDANTAPAAVLIAIGLSPYAASALIQRRTLAPLKAPELGAFMSSIGAPFDRLRVEGNTIVTMRATARLRLPNGALSDMKRTVAAQLKYLQKSSKASIDVLRWYDMAWSD